MWVAVACAACLRYYYCKVKQINFVHNMAGWNIFLKLRVCARYVCVRK